jgi:predicted dehydrogenase
VTARLGLIGCGRIAERGHIPAAAALDSVALVAVCDPDPVRAAAAARQAGGAVAFAGAAEMIEGTPLDGVVIAAPAAHHVDLATLLADAGVRSLVEKPPGGGLEGAAALAEVRPRPAIGFNRRFLQGSALIGAIPASGWLEFDLELSFQQRGWGAHEARDEALLDAGIHLIDLAHLLTGATPIAVREAQVERGRARLELELGRGRARISCATDRPYRELVSVRDRAGRTIAEDRRGRVRGTVGRLRGQDPLVDSLRRQLELFAAGGGGTDPSSGGGQPSALADAGDAVAAMAVIEAARRSHDLDGAEVTVDVPVPTPPAGRT